MPWQIQKLKSHWFVFCNSASLSHLCLILELAFVMKTNIKNLYLLVKRKAGRWILSTTEKVSAEVSPPIDFMLKPDVRGGAEGAGLV